MSIKNFSPLPLVTPDSFLTFFIDEERNEVFAQMECSGNSRRRQAELGLINYVIAASSLSFLLSLLSTSKSSSIP